MSSAIAPGPFGCGQSSRQKQWRARSEALSCFCKQARYQGYHCYGKFLRSWIPLLVLMLVGGLNVGCGTQSAPVPGSPTVASVFQQANVAAAVTPTPKAQLQPILAAAATPTPTYREFMIYDEELAPNWALDYSINLTYELQDTTHWFESMAPDGSQDSGAVSMLVTPDEGWGTLHFTLGPDSGQLYPRDNVQGVSFWVNSNADFMSNDALVVAIVGSNEQTYWLPEDASALTEFGYFPEIPLYDLQVNEAIPPNTWVKVVLSMDKLLFGPDYRYVTGVYMKTKSFQVKPFHIDKVALVLAPTE